MFLKKVCLLLLSSMLFLVACSPKETHKDQTQTSIEKVDKEQVIIAIDSEPESGFDPCLGWGHGISPIIQSTLIKFNADMEIVNDLATSYEISDDGLTYKFEIRNDAKFTNGETVKPSDVAFTFNTAKNSNSLVDLTFVDKCEIQENKIVFILNKPMSTFINTIASIGIVPEHAYSDDYALNPIGSGPWKLVQWNKGEQIILEANENYYAKVPNIKKAVIVFMDENAAFAAANAGAVDVALTSAAHAINKIDQMQIQALKTIDNVGILLPVNMETGIKTDRGDAIGNNVTANKSIRKALAYCMDRDQIAQNAANGFADPAFSENDGMPWNNPEIKINTDVEKAKKILADDGWQDLDNDGILEKGDLKAEFNCYYPSGDSLRQSIGMAAAQQAKNIGIKINIEGLSWDEISKKMFSNAVIMSWGDSNPFTSYLLFHSSNKLNYDYYNPEGFDSLQINKYLEQALNATTSEQANEFWKKAQWDGTTGTSMLGEVPWVWLVNIRHIYYVKDGLDIGNQSLHPHGASWPLVKNLDEWKWN